MDLSYSGLVAYGRTQNARKKLRYAGVSALFLPVSQTLLQVLGIWLDDYTAASLLAAAIATVPNFFANKHFVWRVTSRENLRNQMLVFWVTVMMGVTLATLLTGLVAHATASESRLICGPAVLAAQLLAYGLVWVGRFLILDRWLFKIAGDTPAPAHPDTVIGKIPT